VKSAPEAQPRCAFFDVDGTLISIKSMFSFLDFLIDAAVPISTDLREHRRRLQHLAASGAAREQLNISYYAGLAGMPAGALDLLGMEWYRQIRTRGNLFYPRSVARLRQHQQQAARIVLVSGSFSAVLRPLAGELQADAMIAAPLEIQDGRYTGRLSGQPTIGQGKAEGIVAYLERAGIAAAECCAYGDDISDVPMLECVGRGIAVNPDGELRRLSEQRRWNILEAA
jgi:HAD superfamily hydrolase (TIGR01490 family)